MGEISRKAETVDPDPAVKGENSRGRDNGNTISKKIAEIAPGQWGPLTLNLELLAMTKI